MFNELWKSFFFILKSESIFKKILQSIMRMFKDEGRDDVILQLQAGFWKCELKCQAFVVVFYKLDTLLVVI